MKGIFAIDPGPEVSAWVSWDADSPDELTFEITDNKLLLLLLRCPGLTRQHDVVIEKIQSFGMPVGAEVFDTCVWIGRFMQVLHTDGEMAELLPPAVRLVGRQEVKLHHCHSVRAKDSNIRQAMIDRFGPGKDKAIGKKASPGPLHGVKKDIWSALAIACYHLDTRVACCGNPLNGLDAGSSEDESPVNEN